MPKYSQWNSVTSYLVENIRQRISSGEFASGSKLPSEKALSEEYSVGRSSVREALRTLQAEHAIGIEKGRGSFVLSESVQAQEVGQWYKSQTETFKDLVELRDLIECYAAKKTLLNITEEQIQELESINQSFVAICNAKDYTSLLQYDEAFHRIIIRAAKVELLEDLYLRLEKAYSEYRIKGFIFTKYIKEAADGHAEIIKVLRSGNAERVEEIMHRHIYAVVGDIEKILSVMEEI